MEVAYQIHCSSNLQMALNGKYVETRMMVSALEIDCPNRGTHDGKGYNSDDSVEILEQSPCQKNLVRSTVSSANPSGNAVEDAKKFTSENPTFMVRITPNSRMVRVPGFFVREYFADNKKNVKIRFKKKLWHVRFVLDVDRRGQGRLCGGWTSFARESEMEAGDVCIFDLINQEDAVFDVHIFRDHT
ncbi:hypothetical protein RJT34_07524 [Clitoria ternatea]|uniref:TF-B3 domain-containing protein n=1 Tax=Clitoria ternatea TaxID=43366 RepID=A0AAN9K3E8_CLITE